MNVRKLDDDRWEVESESRPGVFYEVLANSGPARNFGVKYSCSCPSWINNTLGNRTCKHTAEVLKEEIMIKTTENFRNNKVDPISATSSSFRRGRGRPSYDEVKRCQYCAKSSITLKQKGYCKYCFKHEDGSLATWRERQEIRTYNTSREETTPIISDNTVRVEKESLRELAKELGL